MPKKAAAASRLAEEDAITKATEAKEAVERSRARLAAIQERLSHFEEVANATEGIARKAEATAQAAINARATRDAERRKAAASRRATIHAAAVAASRATAEQEGAATRVQAGWRRRLEVVRRKEDAARAALVHVGGSTVSGRCIVRGSGLAHALIGQTATFTIDACNAKGQVQLEGGDAFFVAIRCMSRGTRVRAKVRDLGSGSYLVSYSPPITSGRCVISVSLLGVRADEARAHLLARTPRPTIAQRLPNDPPTTLHTCPTRSACVP